MLLTICTSYQELIVRPLALCLLALLASVLSSILGGILSSVLGSSSVNIPNDDKAALLATDGNIKTVTVCHEARTGLLCRAKHHHTNITLLTLERVNCRARGHSYKRGVEASHLVYDLYVGLVWGNDNDTASIYYLSLDKALNEVKRCFRLVSVKLRPSLISKGPGARTVNEDWLEDLRRSSLKALGCILLNGVSFQGTTDVMLRARDIRLGTIWYMLYIVVYILMI